MDKLKQSVGLTAIGILAVFVASWFLVISPKHSDADTLKAQTASQVTQNSTLQMQLAQLKSQAKELPAQQAKLAAVAAKIPGSSELPSLVRAITNAADDAGLELVSIAPAPAVAVAAPAATTTTATAATGASAASPSGVPSAAGAGRANAAAAGQLDSIQVVMTVAGSYFEVAQFLDRVESLTRAFKVSNVNVAPGANPVKASTAALVESGRALTATITGNVYMATGRTITAPTAATANK